MDRYSHKNTKGILEEKERRTMRNKTNCLQNGVASMTMTAAADRESSSDEDEKWKKGQNGLNLSRGHHRAKSESDTDIIEIDSDDSRDATGNNHNNNNEESSPDRHRAYEQNNNRDSDRESTSSDIVIVRDDYQTFYEEIEQLSKIKTGVQLNPEDKVSMKNFKIHKLLGTGAYGKVFLVEKMDGTDKGRLYAMKVLEKNKVTQKKKTTEHTRTEREVLEQVIDCPFLATLFYAFQTTEKLYLVMEFVQGGELFSHLYKSEHFSEDQVRFYISEIIIALEQLHERKIIYRDIKLENILLDADGHIIITDFGLSKELKDGARATSYCGTIEYMAPEIVSPQGGHDLNVDWWSVGVLIIELLSGQSPFSRDGEESNQQVISERIQKCPPNIPDTIGPEAKDLILKLLEKDPRRRLGYKRDAEDLKRHVFFKRVDWTLLKNKCYESLMTLKLKDKFDVSQFSEDFTAQQAIDGPAESGAPLGPNASRYFRGYSFVAPSLRKKKPEVMDRPEMNRPLPCDVFYAQREGKSSFFKKYHILEESALIGDGTYSLCMKCTSIKSNEVFAVKIMKIDHDASQEIDALEKCQGHANIVKLIEKLHDKYFNYIVFELLNGGELFSRIRECNFLSEPTARLYFHQIMDAVYFMHAKSIVHRDLKPENIMFVDNALNSMLKIVDFGFAHNKTTEENSPCFTLDYAAPESLLKGPTKESRDIWSLGVILYTMLCGNTPFKPLKEHDERNLRTQILENIRKGKYNTANPRWQEISDEAKDLIECLLQVNESERISFDKLKRHRWVVAEDEHFNIDHEEFTEDKSIHRMESEETVINDYDNNDDAISNEDEKENVNQETREETRSNDDSSSGIVMSDRNEGSSISSHHEDEQSAQPFDRSELIDNNIQIQNQKPLDHSDKELIETNESSKSQEEETHNSVMISNKNEEKQTQKAEKIEFEGECINQKVEVVPVRKSRKQRGRKGRRNLKKTEKDIVENSETQLIDIFLKQEKQQFNETTSYQLPPIEHRCNVPQNVTSQNEFEEELKGFKFEDMHDDYFPSFGFEPLSNDLAAHMILYDHLLNTKITSKTLKREKKAAISSSEHYNKRKNLKVKTSQVLNTEKKVIRGRKRIKSVQMSDNIPKTEIELKITKQEPSSPTKRSLRSHIEDTLPSAHTLNQIDCLNKRVKRKRKNVSEIITAVEVANDILDSAINNKHQEKTLTKRKRGRSRRVGMSRRPRKAISDKTVVEASTEKINENADFPEKRQRGRKRKMFSNSENVSSSKKAKIDTDVTSINTRMATRSRQKMIETSHHEMKKKNDQTNSIMTKLMSIKQEPQTASAMYLTSSTPRSQVSSSLSSNSFRPNNIFMNYIDNKDRQSMIQYGFAPLLSCVVTKSEPLDKSSIRIFNATSSNMSSKRLLLR